MTCLPILTLFLASGDFCHLITFANSLVLDQDRQNSGSVHERMFENVNSEKNMSADDNKSMEVTQHAKCY